MNKFIEGGQKREEPKEKKIDWVKIGIIGGGIFLALIVIIVIIASSSDDDKKTEDDPKVVWKAKYYDYLVSSNLLKGSTQTGSALIDFDDNGTPELVLNLKSDDEELMVLYIQNDEVKKSRKYYEGEIKLMYGVNDKKAKWYLSEIDSGVDYYTDLSKLAQGNDEDITKKKEIIIDYADTTVEVDYKNISAGNLENDLNNLVNSYNKDHYINDTLDAKMEKILTDRSNSGNIDEVYKSFLLEKKYNNYINWTSSPNKYLMFDLNGDGTNELFVSYADNSNWYRILVMTFDEKTHALYKVGEIYCYQGIYYNSTSKDFYYSSTIPTGSSVTSNFYKMENNSLVFQKKTIKDNGKYTMYDNKSSTKIPLEPIDYPKMFEGYSIVTGYADLLNYAG